MSISSATSYPNSPGWSRLIERLRAATAGRFTIMRELGRGGFAAVFLAQQQQPSRPVAIKLLLPSHLDSEWALEHFRGESQKISNWRHQSVVTIYEVHEVDDLFFFIMSYVEGASLHDLILHFGTLSVAMTRSVLAQVGSALQYAHRQGVTHRDIKPHNVLIDTDGGAVVTDFGISKQSGGTSHTVTGMIFGTAPYMAPEQCESGTTSILSDQYALGIVAYEMLTGSAPFIGTATSVLLAHLQKPVPPLNTKRNDVPADLEAAIMRMLEKEPSKRFASISEAMQACGVSELSEFHPDRIAFAQAARRLSTESRTQSLDIVSIPAVLEVGDLVPISATARTSAGETLTDATIDWSISDGVVARVDKSNGTLTALVPGVTTLFVKSGKVEQQIQLEIRQPRVTTVQLSALQDKLRVGETTQLNVVAASKRGATLDRTANWSSSDPNIVRISESGVLSAVGTGRVQIKAVIDEVSSEMWLDIAPPMVADLRVTGLGGAFEVGDARQLRATVLDGSDQILTDRAVTWSSSDRQVATVSASGLVTAGSVGKTVITVTCESRTLTLPLEVRLPRVASVEVLAPSAAIKVGDRVRLDARVRGANGDVLERAITWLSDDAAVARVDASGTLIAVAPGSVIVSATVDDVTGATMIDVAARMVTVPIVVTPKVATPISSTPVAPTPIAPTPVAPTPVPVAAMPVTPAPVAKPPKKPSSDLSFTEFFGGPPGAVAPTVTPPPASAPPTVAPPASSSPVVPASPPAFDANRHVPLVEPPMFAAAPRVEPREAASPLASSSNSSPLLDAGFTAAPLAPDDAIGRVASVLPPPPARPARLPDVFPPTPDNAPASPQSRRLFVGAGAGVVMLVVIALIVKANSGKSVANTTGGASPVTDTLAAKVDSASRGKIVAANPKPKTPDSTGSGAGRAGVSGTPVPAERGTMGASGSPTSQLHLRVTESSLVVGKSTDFTVDVERDGKRVNRPAYKIVSRNDAAVAVQGSSLVARGAGTTWIVATSNTLRDSVRLVATAPTVINTPPSNPGGSAPAPVPPPPLTIATLAVTPVSRLERNETKTTPIAAATRTGARMPLNGVSARSSDPNVVDVTMTADGVTLRGRNPGRATISVRTGDVSAEDFVVTVPAAVVTPPSPAPDSAVRPRPAATMSRDEARTIARNWLASSSKALPNELAAGDATSELRSNLGAISWAPLKDVTATADPEGGFATVLATWEGKDGGGGRRRVTATLRVRIEGNRVTSATLTSKPTFGRAN